MNVPAQTVQFEITDLQPTFLDYIQSQKDENTRTFNIQFLFEGDVLSLSGCTATATVTINNIMVEQELACEVNETNHYVTVVVNAPYSGVMAVQVTLTDGANTLTMPRPLFVRVARDIAETAQIDDNTHGSFAEIVREVADARGDYISLAEALNHKLSSADGAVKTANIDTGAVTEKKLATALKNTLYKVNTTDQQPNHETCDEKTIYVGAKLGNERGIIIPFFGKDKQMFIGAYGTICVRHYTGGNDYQDWEPNLSELTANKKTAINSSNQSSTVFFPTIKAVVDYLTANYIGNGSGTVTENNLATVLKNSLYHVDNTTETVAYSADNPRTIYTNARVNGNKPTLVFTLGDDSQLAMYNDGHLYCRTYANGAYGDWIDLKATSIGESNKTSNTLYPSIKAVVDYLVANYENLSNKKTTLTGNESSNDFYPTTKAVADALLGINAGSVGFDETGTYADGSIGAGVSNQKNALNFTNQGALDYALNYDIDLFKFLKWTKGQYVDDSNGNILNNSRFYISDPIEVSDLKSGYLHLVITNSFTLKYAQYDANGDFLLGSSFSSAVDRVLSIQDTCKTIRFSVGAWSGTYTLSDYLNAITIYVKPAHNVVIEDYIGCKELDFLYDNYIVTPSVSTANVSTTPVSFKQCVCLSTPCTKGQIFTITGTPRDNSGSRPVMFLDQANVCIYRSDEASAFNNVEITAPVTGTLVVNFLKAYPFQCYTGFKNLSEKVFKNLDSVNTIKSFPVDLIPDWLTNAMAIRTVGPLQKGYICLTCDDGYTELESYTIPMLLNKQVPCTFGLWASTSKVGAEHPFNKSPVLQTPSGIAAVKNAITAGCSVAQHGPLEWTDMTNEELNEFFDREAAAWEALDINVKGAICPSHCINNAVRVTAGGRFGVVRSGYHGYLSKADQQAVINGDVFAEYKYYCAGPRSNVFGLSSFNTNAVTLSWMKGAVDYAIAQKMILVVYWHDWDLTAEQKSDLEAFIDYAKAQNITFCTLGEIPFLA